MSGSFSAESKIEIINSQDSIDRGTQTTDNDDNPEIQEKSTYQILLSERDRVAKDFEMIRVETKKIRAELRNLEEESMQRVEEESISSKKRIQTREEEFQFKNSQMVDELEYQKNLLLEEKKRFYRERSDFELFKQHQIDGLKALNLDQPI